MSSPLQEKLREAEDDVQRLVDERERLMEVSNRVRGGMETVDVCAFISVAIVLALRSSSGVFWSDAHITVLVDYTPHHFIAPCRSKPCNVCVRAGGKDRRNY